ncbi:MAG: geranyl transferase [Candidatus Thioglobus sp.]|nr:MAG: geranyl transferase [Candidatus Thioglobus sp.]
MRYASIGAGKRYRAALVYASGQALGAEDAQLDNAACAVELTHAFSLVHDDLPAMDDDDLRRGKPSCHRAFDEATAILAGDALQTLAFEVLSAKSGRKSATENQLEMIRTLAIATGSLGLAGGQVIDLSLVSQSAKTDTLKTMHQMKTGALIEASVHLGGLGAFAESKQLETLRDFSRPLGLAFQVVDDILDGTADTATLGKPAGADQEKMKPTYLSLMGEKAARRYAKELIESAIQALDGANLEGRLLTALAKFTLERSF